jgi:isopenicillin N synthase-like dioxygenase
MHLDREGDRLVTGTPSGTRPRALARAGYCSQYSVKVMQVLAEGLKLDDDVVNVEEAGEPKELRKDLIRHPLELRSAQAA